MICLVLCVEIVVSLIVLHSQTLTIAGRESGTNSLLASVRYVSLSLSLYVSLIFVMQTSQKSLL